MPFITSIIVRNPLCQIRKIDCDAEKNDIEPPKVVEAQGQTTVVKDSIQIISPESRKAGPVLIPMDIIGTPVLGYLEVHVTGLLQHDSSKGAGKFYVEASCGNFKMSSDGHWLEGKDSFTFPVEVLNQRPEREDVNVPGGFKGNFKWILRSESGSEDLESSTELEIYWLPFKNKSELPEYLTQAGIPATLLRIFIPNLCTFDKAAFSSKADWVKWAVEIIHGTRHPRTYATQPSSEHWLKYDVYSGGFSFCGEAAEYETGFDLSGWIKAYHAWDSGNGVYTLVNCYDQAGAAEIVLALSYPYSYITWEYHQVYGFIKDCSTLKLFDNANKLDERRSLFRNHAYLSIGEIQLFKSFFKENPNPIEWDKKAGAKRRIVDACAGPHCGDVDRETYTTHAVENRPDVVDIGRLKGDEDQAHRWVEVHIWSAGITGTKDQSEPTHFRPLYNHPSFTPSMENIDQLVPDTGRVKINQAEIGKAFQDIVKKNKAMADPTKDFKGDPDLPYEYKLNSISVTEGTQSTHETFIPGFVEKTYISMTIIVCEDGAAAIARLKSRASRLTPSNGKIEFKTPSTNAAFGKVPDTKVWGTSLMSMFVYRNLVVEINKLSGHANAVLVTVDMILELGKMSVELA